MAPHGSGVCRGGRWPAAAHVLLSGKGLSLEKLRQQRAVSRWPPQRARLGCTTFNAQLITKSDMYVGRLIKKRDTGETVFLAFHHDGEKGDFVGELIDPRPATWDRPTLTFQANLPFTESGQIRQC